jgi:hypothetical protein
MVRQSSQPILKRWQKHRRPWYRILPTTISRSDQGAWLAGTIETPAPIESNRTRLNALPLVAISDRRDGAADGWAVQATGRVGQRPSVAGMAVFVLVHGAWSGAHGFHLVRRKLWAAGHEAYTPSLTGIGERVHLTGPGDRWHSPLEGRDLRPWRRCPRRWIVDV